MSNKKEIYLELKKSIGNNKVTDNLPERLCFSRDVTPICYKWIDLYKKPPYLCDIVVKPETVKDIQKVVKIANKYKTSINVYGGGSGVVGGIIPISGGITIDMSRLDNIINLDTESLTVEVESGIIGQILEDYLNENNSTLRHFPQSFRSAEIGGLIATKSTGQFSSKYGGIEDFVVGLEVVLPNCRILKTSDKPRSSTGPDINNFFIGSEGIYGIITKAILKIYQVPEDIKYQCFLYQDIYHALDSIRAIMQSGLRPPVVRLYNEKESELKFKNIGFNYKGCLLILCFEGIKELADIECKLSNRICSENGGKSIGSKLGELWFENRFDTKHIMEKEEEFGGISDAIEVSASWSKMKNIYNKIENYFNIKGIIMASHFSHAYTNGISLYNIFYVNKKNEKDAIAVFYDIWDDVMKITLDNGGSISHHHGIGLVKSKMLKRELGEGYALLKNLKESLDPGSVINPGKLLNGKDNNAGRY